MAREETRLETSENIKKDSIAKVTNKDDGKGKGIISYVLFIVITSIIFLITSSYVSPTNFNLTNVSPIDLLIIAGITITFYTLLNSMLVKFLQPAEEYNDFLKPINIFILLNIVYVSISIILLLYAMAGSNLIGIAFQIILTSWIFNLAIIITLIISNLISGTLDKRKYNHVIFRIIIIGLLIIGLIYMIQGLMGIFHLNK
jgi:hypothetical protein